MNALPPIKLEKINGDMETALFKIGTALLKDYKFHYAIGASFGTNNSIIAWHNFEMKHTPPIALNLVHTSVIKAFASDEYSISITNKPLPIQPDEELHDEVLLMQAASTFEFLFPFLVYIIMSILSAKYTSFFIEV